MKTFTQLTMNQPSHLCAALLLIALLATIVAAPTIQAAGVLAPTPPKIRPQAAGGSTIPCDSTPFGRVLRLNQANQVFLGYTNTVPPSAGALGTQRFMLDSTGTLLDPQPISNTLTASPNISLLAGTTADLAGDGMQSFVQAFRDTDGNTRFVINKNGVTTQTSVNTNSQQTAITLASGDVLGRNDGTQQVVLASSGVGGTFVGIYDANGLASSQALYTAYWISNRPGWANATLVKVAVGRMDTSGTVGIVLAFLQNDQNTLDLVYLQYTPGYISNDGVTTANGLQLRAAVSFTPGPMNDLQLTLANIRGTGLDTAVIGWRRSPDNAIQVLGWDITTVNGTQQFTNDGFYPLTTTASNFALASGDLYGNQRDDLVLAYNASNGLNIATFGAGKPGFAFVPLDTWQDGLNGRDNVDHIGLAVGDLNKDNRAEVVAAFKDSNPFGFQALTLDADANQHLQLQADGRYNGTFNAPITLSLGDWNNDSVRALVSGPCARVVDANVTAAGFIPPFWQNIQGNQSQLGASFGRSVTQDTGSETSLSYTRSNSVSFFAGAGVQAELPGLFEVSASAKVTGAQEYAMSMRQSTEAMTTTVTTVGQSWGNDALVYDPTEYNCYTYQLSSNNTLLPADQANLRYCAYQGLPGNTTFLQASELNSWDANFATQPEYVPVVRDWSSLALFRGAFTAQSSNATSAPLAVDGAITKGSYLKDTVAQTANEANPWWQVDLGSVQPITKIRLWTPPASLTNVYLFVSNTDFRTIPNSNDPNTLLTAPGVQHYSLADLGNGYTMSTVAPSEITFLTQDNPIQGRYVRVQRTDTAVLALAQVQVFGTNHVDPDRYPLDMRPGAPNSGSFQVLLYNPYHTGASDTYVWVPVRGNLLYDGRQNPPLNTLGVDRGNAVTSWSLSNGTGNTQVQATELDNTSSIGAEFEGEAGSWFKVSAGGGSETSTGLATENTLSTSWSQEFNMGGQMQGFPHEYDGAAQSWVLNCRYRFQPYYYEVTDTSNLGHQHRYPVLDYLVPTGVLASDLNRTLDLTACRNGNLPSPTVQASNETALTALGQSLTLNVLAKGLGNNISIDSVGAPQHGSATFTTRTITYKPDPGFIGVDSFTYTIDSDQPANTAASSGQPRVAAATGTATGTVTVFVGSGQGVTTIYLPIVLR